MSKLHVSCAAEGEYVIHSAAMLHSLLACHPPGTVVIHYLHGPELAERSRGKLQDMVVESGGEVKFWEIPDRWCAGLPTEGFTRTATWYRIFLPDLLPDVSRVVYFDADLIVQKAEASKVIFHSGEGNGEIGPEVKIGVPIGGVPCRVRRRYTLE